MEELRVLRIGGRARSGKPQQIPQSIRLCPGHAGDPYALDAALDNVDYVLYAPLAEGPEGNGSRSPVAAYLNACERARVSKVVCLTADESTDPLSDVLGSAAEHQKKPAHLPMRCSVRCGHPICAPGTPVSVLVSHIRSRQTLILSHPDKSLYLTNWTQAAELAAMAFMRCRDGDILIRETPACSLAVLIQTLRERLHTPVSVRYVGLSFGDKLYETLSSSQEHRRVLVYRTGRRVQTCKRKKGTTAFSSGSSPLMTPGQLQTLLTEQPLF